MADIYVRPYGAPGKRPARKPIWILLLVAAAGGAGWLWLSERPPAGEEVAEPAAVSREAARPTERVATAERTPVAPARGQEAEARQLFVKARDALGAGRLQEADELLDQVISLSTDEGTVNGAKRLQGRARMEMFLSDRPMPQKTSYVIQPGDSLDRIARRNNTTVELIRAMNGIEGNLIYPGHRILLPSEPLWVEVDKTAKTLDVWIGDWRLRRYAVGLGRDGRTPSGTFQTGVHQMNPDWTPPGGGIIPFGDPRNELGTRWMSFHDSERPELRGFGIHGTTERDSIGLDTSNGCVRMLNEDVEELYMLIPQGTTVRIHE